MKYEYATLEYSTNPDKVPALGTHEDILHTDLLAAGFTLVWRDITSEWTHAVYRRESNLIDVEIVREREQ